MFSTEETYSHFCSNLSTCFSVRYEQSELLMHGIFVSLFFIVALFAGTKLRNNQIATILVLKLQSENRYLVLLSMKRRKKKLKWRFTKFFRRSDLGEMVFGYLRNGVGEECVLILR